jgi:hypothetical protein
MLAHVWLGCHAALHEAEQGGVACACNPRLSHIVVKVWHISTGAVTV